MMLIDNWRAIVKKAWSFKLCALALALTAGEIYVGLQEPDDVPPALFSALSGAVIVAAMAARLFAQKELTNGTDK